jgi:hypothetical protein
MPEVQHRTPRRETSIPVSSSTTNLDVTTLGTDPTEAARFLDLMTAEEVDV